MDSTQLPPPTLSLDTSGQQPPVPPQNQVNDPAPAVTPPDPSLGTLGSASATTDGSNAQPGITKTFDSAEPATLPNQPVTAFAPPQPETTPAAETVFRSPIIEGLQQMQTEPFQAPNVPPTSPSPSPLETQPEVPPAPPVEPPSTSDVSAAQPPSSPPPAKVVTPLFGKKWFLALVGGLVVALIALGGWFWWQTQRGGENNAGVSGGQVTLTYWGLWEEKEIMAPLIKKYQDLHPNVAITYQFQNHRQYRSRLQAALREGQGPDIFRFHNTWLPMLQSDMSAAPNNVVTAQQMKNEFYPVVTQDVVRGNQVYGLPLMYDGLALVYNESMLEAANAQPPRDWKSLRDVAASLTIRNQSRLERAGVAMGTADNIDHFSDILGLLMLQNGADLTEPTRANAQSALEFYTMFSRTDGGWDDTMAQSTLAFANEQVAMIFVPSWRIHEIRELNPNLRFGVASMPQLSDTKVTWATYWVEGVSKKSSHSKEAWEFIAWLSQPEQLRQLASEASKYRGFGELYPRVSMASELRSDPDLAPYLEDALYAKSWPLADRTHDEGLNDQLIAYFKDAVNDMNKNGRAANALEAIAPGIKSVLSKFGYVASR